jgi:hypothetical protein
VSNGRSFAIALAMMMMVIGSATKDKWFSDGLRYVGLTYLFVDFVLRIRAGYLRRRPHWTADSWRRYLQACAVPVGALLIVVAALVALDMDLPIVGESRSTLRMLWAMGTGFFIIVGGVGVAIVVGWLTDGEATAQFALPRWLSRRGHPTT